MRSSRLEALSDGIFAIAITLIVLEMHVPQISGDHVTEELLADLRSLIPLLAVYILSFVMLGIYWIGHHNQMHFVHRVDRPFIWINMMFFLGISFIPFSANLLGSYPLQTVSVVIYAFNLIFNGLCLLGIWLYACDHNLTTIPIVEELKRSVVVRISMPVVVYAAAIIVAFFAVPVALGMLLLPPVTQLIPGTVDRHLR